MAGGFPNLALNKLIDARDSNDRRRIYNPDARPNCCAAGRTRTKLPKTILHTLFRRTLCSVYFGITLMVLVAAYIAVGSGCAAVREYFEMNELQFFQAWPLKVLMLLLVLNLSVVTWRRIPFTPPRYGVWCIHTGIILLIIGMSIYYHSKVEGATLIPIKATARYFYDNSERALYARVAGSDDVLVHPLPSLPRFGAYDARLGNAGHLASRDLQEIDAFDSIDASAATSRPESLDQALGIAGARIDIVAYYPYAEIRTDFADDPSSDQRGIRLSWADPDGGQREGWLVADESRDAARVIGGEELEHRDFGTDADSNIQKELGDAVRVHRLRIASGVTAIDLKAEVGKTYAVANTGCTLTVERYFPSWSMFGSGKPVRALSLLVREQSAGGVRMFRRMVLEGEDVQTDFKLVPPGPGAGPMSERQKAPIDPDLHINYRLDDPLSLMPQEAIAKHTLITAGAHLFDVATQTDGPAQIREMKDGAGTIELTVPASQDTAAQQISVAVERHDHLASIDSVIPTPPERRDRNDDEAGRKQVVVVRVSAGKWSREMALPFAQWPLAPVGEWEGPSVAIPGARGRLQLQLGNACARLPANLTLDRFDLVHYPGGRDGMSSVFRDFKSTLRVEDPTTRKEDVAVAHLNSPVYFNGGSWLFFQQSWDGQRQQFTIIGVGTRPGVDVMITGCAMMLVGLMYAFYAKPLIIRRMKAKALARAAVGRVDERQELVTAAESQNT